MIAKALRYTTAASSGTALLKRGYRGTYHQMSKKHLNRHVQEFSGRHNVRESDMIDQRTSMVEGMEHKRLRYKVLFA